MMAAALAHAYTTQAAMNNNDQIWW